MINPLSAKFIKWSNTLKQIVGKLPTICLRVFDHFSGLALKGLKRNKENICMEEKGEINWKKSENSIYPRCYYGVFTNDHIKICPEITVL